MNKKAFTLGVAKAYSDFLRSNPHVKEALYNEAANIGNTMHSTVYKQADSSVRLEIPSLLVGTGLGAMGGAALYDMYSKRKALKQKENEEQERMQHMINQYPGIMT